MRKSEKLFRGCCIAFTVAALICSIGIYGFRGYLLMVLILAAFGGWCAMDANEREHEAVAEAIEMATEEAARATMKILGVENADEIEIQVQVRQIFSADE